MCYPFFSLPFFITVKNEKGQTSTFCNNLWFTYYFFQNDICLFESFLPKILFTILTLKTIIYSKLDINYVEEKI